MRSSSWVHPSLRQALIFTIAGVLAGVVGWGIATGAYLVPLLAAMIGAMAVLSRLARVDVDVALVGIIVAGYIVGNRGFAQLAPAPGLPLLPAEGCLAIALPWMLVRAAFARRLPLRLDTLNYAVLVWLVLGTARAVFDVRSQGLMAVRDYAMVYYALFFFIAQEMSRVEQAGHFLRRTLLASAVVVLPVYVLIEQFPALIDWQIRLLGLPFIFLKGDLAFTFVMVGSVLLFHVAAEHGSRWGQGLATLLTLAVAASASRASLLGGVVAMVLLFATRRRRYPATQGAAAAMALVGVLALASLAELPWAVRERDALLDRVISIVDVGGGARYRNEENAFKADNNQFRLVWWRTVARDTWQTHPWFGLGFGADLAGSFVREYSPDAAGDFSARSPHSIVLTVFGRLGLVGLLVWAGLCAAVLQTSLALLRRSGRPTHWGVAAAPWVILTSACFGVVLEGPMGAVPFWVLLGIVNRLRHEEIVTPPDTAPAS